MKTNHIVLSAGLLMSALLVGLAQSPNLVTPDASATVAGAARDRYQTLLQRSQWLNQRRALPFGEIPAGARERALVQIKQAKQKRGFSAASAPTERWVNIGPAPIQGLPVSPSQAMSGRVADIAVDPLDTNHWLIGAAQGGIWETRNAGGNWRPLTDDQASLAMGAITYAPGNPNVIYAGTGESVFSGDAFAGAGLLKSEDGGQSWHLLGTNAFARGSFSGIRVHPGDANRLVAATSFGSASRAFYIPFGSLTGVHTSDDGGTNWALRLAGHASDVEVHPGDFTRQYAALGSPYGPITNGLLQSANGVYRSLDAGLTWGRISGPWDSISNQLGRIEMAVGTTDPNVLYVSATTELVAQSVNWTGGSLYGIWRTTNAWAVGPAWTRLPDPPNGPFGYWYYHQLSVHPTNASVLYVGEEALHRYNGSFWTMLAGNFDGTVMRQIHVDQHAFAWAGSRLIAGNDGGVWSSMNDGVTWTNHNTELAITQFYDGALHPTNPNFALGGSQDNGTEKWTGSDGWQYSGPLGDGCESAISSRNPDRHWALSTQNSRIWRTLDGSTLSLVTAGIELTNTPFVTQFAKHPSLDDLFIHGTDRLWKCTNFFSGTPAWSSNSPALLYPVTTNVLVNVRTNMLPDLISAMTFAASDATGNTYAYGTGWGTLRLTTNGGRNWINLDPTNALPDRYVTEIAFDPNDANVLWLTMASYYEAAPVQPGHVFKTSTALAAVPTWQNVSPPVNIPHNTIVIDPISPNHVFVGTDIGVWQTTDGGANWAHMGPETGMPNVAVFELELNEPTERIVAFTHGRGAFALVNTNTNAASLRVAQTASANSVLPGCDLTYTVRVQNLGLRQATGVTFADTPPANANFVSVSSSQGACTHTAGAVNCNVGTLAAYSNVTVTIVVSTLNNDFITNRASVTANEPENTPYNNTTTLATSVEVTILPATLSVVEGNNAGFNVVVGNCPVGAFQWQLNGTNLPNATNVALLLANVGADHAGDYRVVLTNNAGTFASSPATLTVLFRPQIVTHPQGRTVVAGEDVTFDVTASGSLPISYEWRRVSVPLVTNTVFANSNSFTLVNVATNQAGNYRVVIRNAANLTGVASSFAALTVLPATAPLAVTEAATGVGADSAVLHGMVNPNGAPSVVFFHFGTNTSYGSQSAPLFIPKGSNAVAVSQPLTGLLAGTTYHYRCVATNHGGISLGADRVFTTTAAALRISGFEMLGNGQFRLQFSGTSGTAYTVLASTNLTSWSIAGTASEAAPGSYEFTDAQAAGHPTRFYRLLSP